MKISLDSSSESHSLTNPNGNNSLSALLGSSSATSLMASVSVQLSIWCAGDAIIHHPSEILQVHPKEVNENIPVGRRSAKPSSASHPAQSSRPILALIAYQPGAYRRARQPDLTQRSGTRPDQSSAPQAELGEAQIREIASENSPVCIHPAITMPRDETSLSGISSDSSSALLIFLGLAHPEIIVVRDAAFPLDSSLNNRLAISKSKQNPEYKSKRAVRATGHRSKPDLITWVCTNSVPRNSRNSGLDREGEDRKSGWTEGVPDEPRRGTREGNRARPCDYTNDEVRRQGPETTTNGRR
ncbi:hypothetical protein U1Q18_020606, partial [Sarracenia purpurea var. burkii]